MSPWFKKHFPRVDKLVDQYGYWGPFLASVWGGMSWIANNVPGITQYGWGAVAFAGLGVTCLTALAVTASLAMYRYFHPLPPRPQSEPSSAPAPAMSVGASTISTMVVAQNPETGRDLRRLFDQAVFVSSISMLDGLLRSAPDAKMTDGPLQAGAEFLPKNERALQFIERIRDKMDPGSERRGNFERAMNHASNMAESDLEQTPVGERPDGTDHLLLRRWMIAHYQCVHAIGFLQRQKAKAEEDLLNIRPELLKRWNQMHDPKAQA